MIRVYVSEYYESSSITKLDKTLMQKAELEKWLAVLDPRSWEWGLTKVVDNVPACIYFRDNKDATAFCLMFDLHNTVVEK